MYKTILYLSSQRVCTKPGHSRKSIFISLHSPIPKRDTRRRRLKFHAYWDGPFGISPFKGPIMETNSTPFNEWAKEVKRVLTAESSHYAASAPRAVCPQKIQKQTVEQGYCLLLFELVTNWRLVGKFVYCCHRRRSNLGITLSSQCRPYSGKWDIISDTIALIRNVIRERLTEIISSAEEYGPRLSDDNELWWYVTMTSGSIVCHRSQVLANLCGQCVQTWCRVVCHCLSLYES